jgi:hypothetical protein
MRVDSLLVRPVMFDSGLPGAAHGRRAIMHPWSARRTRQAIAIGSRQTMLGAEDVVFLSTKLMYHRVALHTVSKGMLTRSSSRSPAGWDLPEASGGQDGTGNGSGRTGGPLCRRPRLRVHSTHAASSFAACSRSTKPRPSSSSGSSQSSRLAGRLSRSPPASMPKASPAAWRPVECVDDPRGPGEGDGHPQQSALCRSTDVGTPAVAPQSGQRKARTALSLAGPL